MIQIEEDSAMELKEHAKKALKHMGKLMECVENSVRNPRWASAAATAIAVVAAAVTEAATATVVATPAVRTVATATAWVTATRNGMMRMTTSASAEVVVLVPGVTCADN